MAKFFLTALCLATTAYAESLAHLHRRSAEAAALPEDVINAITAFAFANNWEPRAFAAVVEVESGGKAFTSILGKKLPLILYEYHVFYRNLPVSKRAEAVKQNLARRKWRELPYARTQARRYDQLRRAALIDEEAAFRACSWGVGQVLGENADYLGFPSSKALAEHAMSGINGQLDLMVRFIKKRGISGALKRKDWRAFARVYNGPGQVDDYSTLMARAYTRLRFTTFTTNGVTTEVRINGTLIPSLESAGVLKKGVRGDRVVQMQEALKKLGHEIAVDGIFGPKTEEAVRKFQQMFSLVVDGKAGKQTLGQLDTLLAAMRTTTPENVETLDTIVPVQYELLKKGASGERVVKMQEALNTLGHDLATDGIFGSKTEDAVKKFQKVFDLLVDGKAGKETLGKMDALLQDLASVTAVDEEVPVAAPVDAPATPGLALAPADVGVVVNVPIAAPTDPDTSAETDDSDDDDDDDDDDDVAVDATVVPVEAPQGGDLGDEPVMAPFGDVTYAGKYGDLIMHADGTWTYKYNRVQGVILVPEDAADDEVETFTLPNKRGGTWTLKFTVSQYLN